MPEPDRGTLRGSWVYTTGSRAGQPLSHGKKEGKRCAEGLETHAMAQIAEGDLKRAAAAQGAGDVSAHEEQLPMQAAATALHSVVHEGRLQLTVMVGAREQVSTLFKRLMNPRVVHLHHQSARGTCMLRPATRCAVAARVGKSIGMQLKSIGMQLKRWVAYHVTPIAAMTRD